MYICIFAGQLFT